MLSSPEKIQKLKQAISEKEKSASCNAPQFNGPWSVADKHPTRASLTIFDLDGHEVAYVVHVNGDPHTKDDNGIWRGDEKRIAVAKLISSAPTMLSALENVFALMTNPNAFEPDELMRQVINALVDAGHDRKTLEACIPAGGVFNAD